MALILNDKRNIDDISISDSINLQFQAVAACATRYYETYFDSELHKKADENLRHALLKYKLISKEDIF